MSTTIDVVFLSDKFSKGCDELGAPLQQKTIQLDNTGSNSIFNISSNAKKDSSPLWSCVLRTNRKAKPNKITGVMLDYDAKKFDVSDVKSGFDFFYHQTHSGNHRIIIPFLHPIPYSGKRAYKDLIMGLLSEMFMDVASLFEKNILQRGCLTPTQFFHVRPTDCPLNFVARSGFYEVKHQFEDDTKTIGNIHVLTAPKNYETVPIKTKVNVLLSVHAFYSIFRDRIHWGALDTNGVCLFDWHPKKPCGSLFNYPTKKFRATIHCKHASCETKLSDYMLPIMRELLKGNYPVKTISSNTVLYITAAILQGHITGWTLDHLYHTIFEKKHWIHSNLFRIGFLTMNPQADAVNWVKLFHRAILYHPLYSQIYEYNGACYDERPKEHLEIDYNYYLSAICAVKTFYNSRGDSLTYAKKVLTCSMGFMKLNFELIKKNNVMVLKNGVFLFKNGRFLFLPHSPQFFSTTLLPYDYDPKASCKTWLECLASYFGSPTAPQITLLQEYFGYCLTYDRSLEKLMLFFGSSRSGKGTIASVLLSLVGGNEVSSDDILKPERRHELLSLRKVVFVDEFFNEKQTQLLNELKKLSSTNKMVARQLYGGSYLCEEVPKFLIAFNKAPEHLNFDIALKNRIMVIKFTKTFSGNEDTQLKKKLQTELSGIFNWALEGYKRLYKARKFTKYNKDGALLYSEMDCNAQELVQFLRKLQKKKIKWSPSELRAAYEFETGDHIGNVAFSRMLKGLGLCVSYRTGKRFYMLENLPNDEE
jgi:hypothetical protein